MSFLHKFVIAFFLFANINLTVTYAESKEASVPTVPERVLRAFTSCDAAFFQELQKDVDLWRTLAPMASAGSASWIRVPSRAAVSGDESQNTVNFSVSPSVQGMKLLAYFDNMSDLGPMGLIYEWGFLIDGDVSNVARKLRPLVRDSDRFIPLPSGDYARVEVRSPDSTQWRPTNPEPGVAPTLSKIERALIVEGVENKPHVARVYCTVQGGVKAETLKELRPDIESRDYPTGQSKEVSFANTNIPDRVLSAIKLATSGNDSWKPKFKNLKIAFGEYLTPPPDAANNQPKSPQGKPYRIFSFRNIKMVASDDGLVSVTEEDLNGLVIQRQTLAGWIPLKRHQTKFTDGRTELVTELGVKLPSRPASGSSLNYEAQLTTYPVKAGDNNLKRVESCTATDSINTSDMFPGIQGGAVPYICNDDQGNGQISIFLEDLGVFITMAYGSKTSGWATRKILSAIEVTR